MFKPMKRPGRPSFFPDQPEKHKIGLEDFEIMLSVKFRWIPFSVSANHSQGRPSCFSDCPKNTNLVEDVGILLPVRFRWIPLRGFREVKNVSVNQKSWRPSCFSDRPENTNLVEDVEILLLVRFRWIPFRGFREEVEKSQPIRDHCGNLVFFSDRPKKHKLGRGRWDIASYSMKYVQLFQRRSRKCLSQSEAMAAILFFRSSRKTQTCKRTLISCFLSSFVEFNSAVSEEKSKMSQSEAMAVILFFRSALKTQTW